MDDNSKKLSLLNEELDEESATFKSQLKTGKRVLWPSFKKK